MNRTRLGLLLAATAWALGPLAFSACSNNNNSSPGQDSGTDATTLDSGGQDGATEGATADSSSDGSACGYDAANLNSDSVDAGFFAVWRVYQCYRCHQKASQMVDDAGGGIVLSGNNDGIGDSGMVFPPNLTSDPATGLGCWTDDQIANAILHGTDVDGGRLCPQMPKFGNALMNPDGAARPGTPMDAGTAAQIVQFLRSLPVVSNQVMDTMCPMMGDAGMDGAAADGDAQTTDTGPEATTAEGGDGATE